MPTPPSKEQSSTQNAVPAEPASPAESATDRDVMQQTSEQVRITQLPSVEMCFWMMS